MIKFKYLGKKKNFKLDPVYSMQKALNRGDVFELGGKDVSLMKRCITITKEQCAGYSDFVLCAEEDFKKAQKEFAEVAETAEATTVDAEPAVDDVPADSIADDSELSVGELRNLYKGRIKNVHTMKKETILKRIKEGV